MVAVQKSRVAIQQARPVAEQGLTLLFMKGNKALSAHYPAYMCHAIKAVAAKAGVAYVSLCGWTIQTSHVQMAAQKKWIVKGTDAAALDSKVQVECSKCRIALSLPALAKSGKLFDKVSTQESEQGAALLLDILGMDDVEAVAPTVSLVKPTDSQ